MIRTFILLLSFCSLAACTVEPLVPRQVADTLSVRAVTVDTASVRTQPTYLIATLGMSDAQLEADFARALRRELVDTTRGGTRPVIIDFRLEAIELHSSVLGIARVYPHSLVRSVVQIRDARTGEIIRDSAIVIGDDNLGKYTLGAASQALMSKGKTTRQAYEDVVNVTCPFFQGHS